MNEPDIAFVANLFGEPARAAICLALCGGYALPAGELARRARISPQTASSHLNKLIQGGIIKLEIQGRWRYFRLAGAHVAHVVESLAVIAPRQDRSPVAHGIPRELAFARTCYNHFAGKLAVAITNAMLEQGWIEDTDTEYLLTQEGRVGFEAIGIGLGRLRPKRQPLIRKCLDWTERRHHIAGPVAAAMVQVAFSQHWVQRVEGGRAVLLTSHGRSELRRIFKLRLNT